MTVELRVHENGQPIDFSYEAILDYHGRSAPDAIYRQLPPTHNSPPTVTLARVREGTAGRFKNPARSTSPAH